jgi:hypothetical protein
MVAPEMVTSGLPERGSGCGDAQATNAQASATICIIRRWQEFHIDLGLTRKNAGLKIPARTAAMLLSGMDPKKLIFWLFKWGWRGPVALALVIFGLWLYSLWIY